MGGNSLLNGAYDIHVHTTPDVVDRKQDLVEMALEAGEEGMAGVVLKDHTTSTAGRAYALNSLLNGKTRFYSCLALNPPVGGLNVTAVEAALKEKVSIIFFPTYGARNHIKIWGLGKAPTAFPVQPGYTGEFILTENEGMRPEVDQIIDLVAQYDAVLATGHLSPPESLALLERAAGRGVRRLLLTHASESVTPVPLEIQRRAAALGALVEHCFFAATQDCPSPVSVETIRDQINAVGPGSVILSSDFGQIHNPPPVAGFKHYLEKLQRTGISEDAVRTMICDNPARLLGGTN